MTQSQRTSPAQVPSEEITSLESGIEARYQAFAHEVEQMRNEWERTLSGQCDALDFLQRRQEHVERQTKGLKSFASHEEKFLAEQHSLGGGAQALSANTGQERRKSSREHRRGSREYIRLDNPNMFKFLNHQVSLHPQFLEPTLAPCGVRFVQEPLVLTLATRSSGLLERQPS